MSLKLERIDRNNNSRESDSPKNSDGKLYSRDWTRGRRRRLGRRGNAEEEVELETPAENSTQSRDEAVPNAALSRLAGECQPGVCGEEAACKPLAGAYHQCLCPHDASHATADLKCPIRLTVPINFTPKPIYDIILPRGSRNSSTTQQPQPFILDVSEVSVSPGKGGVEYPADLSPAPEGRLEAGGVVLAGGAGAALLLLAVLLACWLCRTSLSALLCGERCRTRKAQPQPGTGEPLLPNRYITNPQYIPYSGVGAMGAAGAADAGEGLGSVPRLDSAALTFFEEIGEGCFGKVFRGVIRGNGDGAETVAIKVLKAGAGRAAAAAEDFAREAGIMSSFRHPNILALRGVVYREDVGGSPWMVFEYMQYGDLAGVLRARELPGGQRDVRDVQHELPVLDARTLLYVALQVGLGMRYLASRRFVHRDLACRNCLVGSNVSVKIADFGMSRDVYTCDYYKMGGERPMPVRWMSPESIVYSRFTLESDVWSFGVVLWEIYSRGKTPFYGHNNEGATKLILQGIMLIPPEDCPRFACELMRACWRSDPRDRISFEEICDKLQRAYDAPSAAPALPRPPTAPHAPNLDAEGYLLPAPPAPPDYLTPLPAPRIYVRHTEDGTDTDTDTDGDDCSDDARDVQSRHIVAY